MPRLRVTAILSLSGLLVGIAGAAWLSGLTDDGLARAPRVPVRAVARLHRAPVRPRAHAAPRVVGAQPETAAPPTPAELVPLDTPPGPFSWAQLRGHLDGRVVLAVATDGDGQVTRAYIVQSSGDPVLDAHAVATVQRWRFAVPAGEAGVRGELPMRFDSHAPPTPP